VVLGARGNVLLQAGREGRAEAAQGIRVLAVDLLGAAPERVAGRLPADEEGFVRYAQVIVNLENRRAVEVLRVGFFQHRALKNSSLDHRYFREVMATVPEAAFGWLQLDESPPGVVAAEHKFAKRRLDHLSTWKPTRDELSKLRDLVNHKAGREIM
jgi:hypothetical protein